jgi:hypothetical protein
MKQVGLDHFSSILSDSTGITKCAQELVIEQAPCVIEQAPCVLDPPDPVHHTHNTCQEIADLDCFSGVSCSACSVSVLIADDICCLVYTPTPFYCSAVTQVTRYHA